MEYSEEIKDCSHWIKNRNFEKVCIQLPDYMLNQSVSISSEFERLLSYRVYILGDTSYGSCCVDETAAHHIAADCIVHFGRSCLTPNSHLPVYYILPKQSLDVVKCADLIIKTFITSEEPVLVVYDVAYHHLRDNLAKYLSAIKCLTLSNLDLPVQESTSDSVFKNEYISLYGRRFPNLNYKYIVYIIFDNYMNNADRFILEKKECEFYIFQSSCDVLTCRTLTSVIKKKHYIKEKIKDSIHIGVLICSLSIKDLLERISRIKSLCKKANKKCYIFSVGRPNVAKLANFPEIEVFVNITCAEGVIENQKDYMQTIVNIDDIELALEVESTNDNLPDVSLVTNKLRNVIMPTKDTDSSSELNIRNDMSLTTVTQNRTWTGLNPQDTRPPVIIATEGRKGTPSSGYTTNDSNHRS